MRSSKSRSRSKSSRSRSVGNIVNRVFDSSGPEGKVRGTPQQIIEKYNQLARDAQLSNDRVATENFQQHAEHYTRLQGEAMREQDARREAQDAQHRERQQHQSAQNQGDGHSDQPAQTQADRHSDQPVEAPRGEAGGSDRGASAGVLDIGGDGDSGLVETPESTPVRPQGRGRSRSRAKDETVTDRPEAADPAPEPTAGDDDDTPDTSAAAE